MPHTVSKAFTAMAAERSRLHRQSHTYIHNFNLMPTHSDNEVLQEIDRNKQKQAASCQTAAKPRAVSSTASSSDWYSEGGAVPVPCPASPLPNCCNSGEEAGMQAIAQPTVSGF